MIGILLLIGPGLVAAAEDSTGPRAQQAAPSAPEEVELRGLPKTAVVFIEHRGPYWRMGGLFRQVAEFMAAHDQPGPMFTRYLDDPVTVSAEELRAQVGFFVRGEVNVSKPFTRAEWPSRRVAALAVRGHYGRAPAAYERVFEWIAAQGFRPEGRVTEVYLTATGTAAPGGRVTEIRVRLSGAADRAAVEAAPEPRASRELAPSAKSGLAEQVAVRLAAIRRAVAASYPDRSAAVEAYLGPMLLSVEWQQVRATGGTAEFGGADPEAAALLAGLDALLVNVTLGTLEPAEVLEHLAKLSGRATVLQQPSTTGEDRQR